MASRFGLSTGIQTLVSIPGEDALFVAIAFVGGAIVGSFLNVVGFRVPAGRSVIAGRSACPACGHPVRARDNLPILGWLLLGGRCRDCGSRIAADYPLIEAACGLALAMVAIAEIVAWRSKGSPLPILDRVVVLGEWRWLIGWLAKAAAMFTIVAWSLLARGGHRVTRQTAAIALLVIGAMAAAGGASGPWSSAVEAAVTAILLMAARRLLGAPCTPGREVAGATGIGSRWWSVAVAGGLFVVGWTIVSPATAAWLANWFRVPSAP